MGNKMEESNRGAAGRVPHPELVKQLTTAFATSAKMSVEELADSPLEAEALLRDAKRERATDIHLDSQLEGMLVRLRIDGVVLDTLHLSHEQGRRLANQFKAMARLNPTARFSPEEGRITRFLAGEPLDLRITHVPCLRGDKLAIRLFTQHLVPQELDALGMSQTGLEHIAEWLDNLSGMLLVAGPTGSGKTTTLYSLLHRLKLHERNVITIEDPVEYEIDGINHIQVDPVHGLGFVEGMKAMLRLDPDYLMLGEIRDAPSARAALTASASGHALMSTLHSRDAVGVIDTLRNYGLDGHEISANLMLVVAQRLVRRLCPHCKKGHAPSAAERHWLTLLGRKVPRRVWHAVGCEACHHTGYLGRTGVFEVWRIDPEEYQLLLHEADRRTLYRHLAQRGHLFLLDDGLAKVAAGLTSIEELHGMGGFSVLGDIDR